MKSKKRVLCFILALYMMLSLSNTAVWAAAGDNLTISNTAWGQLIDPAGAQIFPKGDQMIIPVTITVEQGTILVTTPCSGENDEEMSQPEVDSATGLYKNVVFIDTVSKPGAGGVYTYAFGFDPAMVAKGQTLYVKVGGTNVAAGNNQKATTTYLGAVKPSGSYSAALDSNKNLIITTPSTTLAAPTAAAWTNPTIAFTISGDSTVRKIFTGITATDTSITVSNNALAAACTGLSDFTITAVTIQDLVIEDITLADQHIAVALALGYGDINSDGTIDISDVIMAAEIAVGYGGYTSEQIIKANVSDKTDPAVDISDVVLIAERAVGGTKPFPVE